jgi:hypothetical protein
MEWGVEYWFGFSSLNRPKALIIAATVNNDHSLIAFDDRLNRPKALIIAATAARISSSESIGYTNKNGNLQIFGFYDLSPYAC